ncbi:MAG: hypothetical protein JWN02_589 [Acidobacteria bacterium]|nr:hypothetical protein [Acidobacteriota bacterium]
MTSSDPVTFTEDRIPAVGIEETISELIELYGGELTSAPGACERQFVLPLRRGVVQAGAIECTLTWAAEGSEEARVTLSCERDVDAPKTQRVLMLLAGVIGALLFMIWPFFPPGRELGTLAWVGGAVAIAVFLMTLRKTSGGLAYDFLQRLARRQRAIGTVEDDARVSRSA